MQIIHYEKDFLHNVHLIDSKALKMKYNVNVLS